MPALELVPVVGPQQLSVVHACRRGNEQKRTTLYQDNPMDALRYKDFDLDIDPGAGRHYPVRGSPPLPAKRRRWPFPSTPKT